MGITPQKLQYYGEAGNLNGLASHYWNQGVAEIPKTKRTRGVPHSLVLFIVKVY
jgi:hypothetical protein